VELLLFYSFRNLLTRRLTTFLTASGMALVVFVFASIVMLAEGLQKTLVETGSWTNVVVLRRSAGSEMQSGIDREQAAIVETQPEVSLGSDGRRLVAKELVVLINLRKRDSGSPTNVIIRGISETSLKLRPQVKLAVGRFPRPGSSEIVAGMSIAKRFENVGLGRVLSFAMRSWTIVGIFDAGNTGFSSEIWGDVEGAIGAGSSQYLSHKWVRNIRRGNGKLLVYHPQADIGYHAKETPAVPFNGYITSHHHVLHRGGAVQLHLDPLG